MNRTIADSINPTVLAALIGGQKPDGNGRFLKRPGVAGRLKRRRYGICDTITPLHVKEAFASKDVRIMPKTAFALHSHIMNGAKMVYRGIKIHSDKRRNKLFTYRI